MQTQLQVNQTSIHAVMFRYCGCVYLCDPQTKYYFFPPKNVSAKNMNVKCQSKNTEYATHQLVLYAALYL